MMGPPKLDHSAATENGDKNRNTVNVRFITSPETFLAVGRQNSGKIRNNFFLPTVVFKYLHKYLRIYAPTPVVQM